MIDFNQFGKSTKGGTATATPTASVSTPAPVKKSKIDFGQFGKSNTYAAPAPVEDKGSMLGSMAKSLVTAPATMIARPLQLAAEAILPGDNTEALDRFSKEKLGGIVAPIPQNYGDVKKDVGRGVQTVALGTGAPIAGGAAFGFGASLEQGNDVFSTETLTQTLIGLGAGKALDLVGKPLLDATGKVIGAITPKILKDVAAQGAGAVEKFMSQHQLLGGVAKPLSEKIVAGAQAFDTGVNKVFKGAGNAIATGVKSQYPGATKESVAKHYEKVEMDRLMEPTKVAGKTYNKSADVAKDAQRRKIDIRKVAADNKIYVSEHITDGKFDTKDVADALADETMSGGPEILRPALASADPGVQRVPLSEVRNRILQKIGKVKDTVLSPEQKLAFAKKVVREYADDSVTGQAYRDGYNLTNLYDSKLQTSSKLYKASKTGGVQSISDSLIGQQKKIESEVFDELLRKNAPTELGLDAYFKAQESRFALSNYLRTLDGNKAPQTLFQRGVRRAAQLAGATTGAQVAGPFGMFSGYQFGGIVSDTFATASNPVKIAYLKSIGKTTPEIYGIMKNYVTEQEAARLLRMALPGPSQSVSPELMRMQNKQGAVEMGYPFKETTPGQVISNDIRQNSQRLFNTKELPAPEPRIITPNTQGTPNPIGAPYRAGGDLPRVGGLEQRTIFKGENVPISKVRIDFKKPDAIDNFIRQDKKFMITTSDNPLGQAQPTTVNYKKNAEFNQFLKENNIHYTDQKGKYGGNFEDSKIIEIDNPQQQKTIDNWLEANSPQNENIMVVNGKAVRYDPRTGEAYGVGISKDDLHLPDHRDDFYSQVNGTKYAFNLYSDEEQALTKEAFNKLYNR